VIVAALLSTALLAVPFLAMQPDTSASQEPGGAVFDARDRIDERFVSSVFVTPMIAESRDGDMLRKAPLEDLHAAEQALRSDPEIGPGLLRYFDAETRSEVVGIRSVATLVDEALHPGGLVGATQAEIDEAVVDLVDQHGIRSQILGLSARSSFDDVSGRWVSPALFVQVVEDAGVLGFSNASITLGGDTVSEEHARSVLEVIRGDAATYDVWGIAIDVNLTSQEQGEAAGPFIGFTILAVLVVVGVAFRSYWVLAITGAALASLIIWLQGFTNLLGFEDDLILSLIVPIAMISFGVDFAFHAVGRYREQQSLGLVPRAAFTTGIAAVAAALVLALASDAVAFLSNVSSGIESIIQFGIGAAIALLSAFLLLGIVTPLVVSLVEDKIGTPPRSRARTMGRLAGSVGAAMLAMATVLLQVFILPAAGVVALVVYLLVALVIPYRLTTARPHEMDEASVRGTRRVAVLIGRVLARVAHARRIVLPLAGVITVGAGLLATQVATEFDVKDFFAGDSDFVVGLDKLDEHVGDRGGEPAQLYIEARLDDPAVLSAIAELADDVRGLDSPRFARDVDGEVMLIGGVLDVVDEVWSSPAALGLFAAVSGEPLVDADGDGIPDDPAQLRQLYALTREIGVPFDAERLVLTPDAVAQSLWVSPDGNSFATVVALGLTDSRVQESIVEARDVLADPIDRLRMRLDSLSPGATVQLTGSPIVRQSSLEAISRALQISLPIAVVLCLLIAAGFLRSMRYGLVVITPILMTVAWLYAFMQVFGFTINIVTATIGAVSIGIGIDFAIHYAVRYREELATYGSRLEAVRIAGEGTGAALVASALSSVVGFAILALAPMPLFASYGLLTAVMILMALVATLIVLPSLLVLVTRDIAGPDVPNGSDATLQAT
jgi:predicted RND superfamily exporter protein